MNTDTKEVQDLTYQLRLNNFMRTIQDSETNGQKEKETKDDLYNYFKDKITPVELMQWLARANIIIHRTTILTQIERSCAGNFAWRIGSHFMPVFINSQADEETLHNALYEAFDDEHDYLKEGIANIGIAYFKETDSSDTEYVKEFLGPLCLFREMCELL